MALATTTLSSAVLVGDTSIVVASATSMAAGRLLMINGEVMRVTASYTTGTTVPVLRGQDGTVTAAHATTTNVTHGLASDFATPPTGVASATTRPAQPAFPIYSYSASGALTAVQGIHILNGTSQLVMTIGSPTKDQDGQIMIAVSNGKANSTITYTTTGFGANTTSSDVLTFHASQQQAVMWIAANGIWCLVGLVSGAATVAGVGLA